MQHTIAIAIGGVNPDFAVIFLLVFIVPLIPALLLAWRDFNNNNHNR